MIRRLSSALTGKRVKGDNDSAIKEHLLFCNHTPDFDLATNNNDFKVTSMESLLINRDHHPLNTNRQSFSLELFDSYSANIRLDEDVLKTSFVFVFRRRLDQDEYVRLSLTSSEDVLVRTNIFVLAICLQDVFKMSSRRL